MTALANRKRPRTLQDVQGHAFTVSTLSLVIANDLWAEHSPLFLQGSPGSGKTSMALLSARATLCPNRVGGTANNCGTCATCRGEDTTNIVQYTCTGADADAISNLIDIGRGQPLPKEGSPRYRFFILDEVSNMTNQQLSKFLEVLETTNPFNVWILVSMKPEKLDATLANALLSRCSTFTFPPLTTTEIASTLVKGGVPEDIAMAISPYCRGNARLAWRKFDSLLLLNPDATPEWIEVQLTGGATKEARASMWGALHRQQVKKVMELVQGWSCDPDTLITLIKEDIVHAMCRNPNPTQGKLLHAITTSRDEDTLYLLLAWVGEDVLGLTPQEAPLPTIMPMTNYARAVLSVPSVSTTLNGNISGCTLNGVSSHWAVLRDKYGLVGV